MDSGNSYRLDKQITELTKEIFKEGTMEYQELLEKVSMEDFIELDKRLRQECRKVEQQLSAAALELMAAVAREGLAIDDFSYKRSGALAMFIRLAEDDYSKLNEPHVRADDAYNKSVLWSKSTPAEVKSRMEALMPEFAAMSLMIALAASSRRARRGALREDKRSFNTAFPPSVRVRFSVEPTASPVNAPELLLSMRLPDISSSYDLENVKKSV